MKRKMIIVLLAGLLAASSGWAQKPPEKKPPSAAPQPGYEFADALAQRLGSEMNVKTSVGEPIKVGAVTLIPIVMIDVGFGGGQITAPGIPSAAQPAAKPAPSAIPALGGGGFYMSGEARPLGFVAITKKGTRFISVAKTAGNAGK